MNPIAEVEISKEFDIEFDYVDGKLVLTLGYEGKGVGAEFALKASPEYFISKIMKAVTKK